MNITSVPSFRPWLHALVCVLLALLPLAASAQTSVVPGLFSYQGKVSNASGVFVGTGTPVNRTVTFRIWSHATNSTASDLVYSEQQVVTISEGEFSVLVGQGTAVTGETTKGPPTVTIGSAGVFAGVTRYLGVTVDDGTAAADTEISPRQQIVSTAYALRAKFAESVGANGTNALTALDNGNVGIGTTTPGFPLNFASTLGDKISLYGNSGNHFGLGIQPGVIQLHSDSSANDITFGHGSSFSMTETVRFKGNGNVGIGTASPANKLDVVGSASFSLRVGIGTTAPSQPLHVVGNSLTTGTVYLMDTFNSIRVVGGSGLHLSSYLADDGIVLQQLTGNVGINDTTPATKLEVGGGIRADGGLGYTFNGVGDTDGGLYSPADGTLTLNTNAIERVRINSAGNVGIGTSSPGFPLNFPNALGDKIALWGNTGNHFGFGIQGGVLQIHTDGSASDILLGYGTSAAMTETLRVKGTGALQLQDGTSRTYPAGLVTEVNAQLINYGINDTRFGTQTNANQGGFLRVDARSTSNLFQFFGRQATRSAGIELVSITSEGKMGISKSNPETLLHVAAGYRLGSFNRQARMQPDATGDVNEPGFNLNDGSSNNVWGGRETSIIADGRIKASSFDCTDVFSGSDVRIKRIVGPSSGDADLQTLMGLEVTDYFLKDQVTHSSAPQKKVIAQQVEKVFPQAVSRSTEVVPDLYKFAAIADGWVKLATDLKVGDRVRLISEQETGTYAVLEVLPDRFRTAFSPTGDEVFVYGREVTDFRSIDYDALAMLNVSATQALKREKDSEIAALRAQVDSLAAKDRARDEQVAALAQLVRELQATVAGSK